MFAGHGFVISFSAKVAHNTFGGKHQTAEEDKKTSGHKLRTPRSLPPALLINHTTGNPSAEEPEEDGKEPPNECEAGRKHPVVPLAN